MSTHMTDKDLTLERLLEIENTLDILDFTCPKTGVLLWPAVRNQFFRFIISDLLYNKRPLIEMFVNTSHSRIAQLTLRATLFNFSHSRKPAQVLVFASGAGRIEIDGFSFNKYTGYFSKILQAGMWSIEGLPYFHWPLLNKKNNLNFSTPANSAIRLYSLVTVKSRHKKKSADLVELIRQRARDLLGLEIDSERLLWLTKFCARHMAAYPLWRLYYRSCFKHIKPHLILAEEACYGHMAMLNFTAKEYNIPVAEYQHGVISKGHDAYNVSPVLASSEAYSRTQPNYLLTYGSWWGNQTNAPVNEVVIGNPHRTELLKTPRCSDHSNNNVLILGDGIETEMYIQFSKQLAKLVSSKFKVVFRPHPLERKRVLDNFSTKIQGFSLDNEIDIYKSLFKAHVVVSEMSTGLFEAVGISDRVFVLDTEKSRFSLPEHLFASIKTPEELSAKLESVDQGRISLESMEPIWASDWEKRFKHFMNGFVK